MTARTFCSINGVIYWNTGRSTPLNSEDPVRLDDAFQVAEEMFDEIATEFADVSTGDIQPVFCIFSLSDFHTEEVE